MHERAFLLTNGRQVQLTIDYKRMIEAVVKDNPDLYHGDFKTDLIEALNDAQNMAELLESMREDAASLQREIQQVLK